VEELGHIDGLVCGGYLVQLEEKQVDMGPEHGLLAFEGAVRKGRSEQRAVSPMVVVGRCAVDAVDACVSLFPG
jgi:hypothetical protein